MIDFRKLYNTYDREDLINTCVNLKHSKERLSKEVNKSYIVCDEKDKEIEILNNRIEKAKHFIDQVLGYHLSSGYEQLDKDVNELYGILKGEDKE